MESKLNKLFSEWNKLGAAVLVAIPDSTVGKRKPEELISESTNWCRYSGRLTWVVIDWLIRNIDYIDDSLLFEKTSSKGNIAVLGLLCDAANQKKSHVKFSKILKTCQPNDKLEIFFHRVAKSTFASKLAKENALPLFYKWNFVSNELRYL